MTKGSDPEDRPREVEALPVDDEETIAEAAVEDTVSRASTTRSASRLPRRRRSFPSIR